MLVRLHTVVSLLCTVYLTFADDSSQECASKGECLKVDDEEDASLLQLQRASPAKTASKGQPAGNVVPEKAVAMDGDKGLARPAAWMPSLPCPGVEIKPLSPSQTSFMVDKYSTSHLGWWNYPVQQDLDVLGTLKSELPVIPWGPDAGPTATWIDMRAASATDAIRLMHEATNVAEVVSTVPDKFRGVFWMKGNGAAEELVVLQYGLWNAEENLLQTTMQPFNWAWAGGKPAGAPAFGALYSDDFQRGMEGAAFLVGFGNGFSYSFGECTRSCKYCNGGGKDDLACGYMESSVLSNLETASNLGNLYDLTLGINTSNAVTAAYTLQAMSDDGTEWKRTVNWGLGQCGLLDFGSYDLVKVMDGDGNPVQPHYDDFVKYQGEVPLLLWAGWENATSKSAVAQAYADATGTVPVSR